MRRGGAPGRVRDELGLRPTEFVGQGMRGTPCLTACDEFDRECGVIAGQGRKNVDSAAR